jgi:hypothetical protein
MARSLRTFASVADAFAQNIYSVRVWAYDIAHLADEHDRAKDIDLLVQVLAMVGVSNDEITHIREVFSPSAATSQGEASQEGGDSGDADNNLRDLLAKAMEAAVRKSPDRVGEVIRLAKFAKRVSARQGRLLRQGAITILVSFFEGMLVDLVQEYYLRFPDGLPAESSALTLAELRRLGSIEDAEAYVASKAAESLLREALEGQLKFFTSRLKINFTSCLDQVERLTEVTQRRNLIVHNKAVVNRIYLEKAPQSFIALNNITEGDTLENSPAYLDSAISAVEAIGFLLIQHSWRKWDKDDIGTADKFVADHIYDLLVDARYLAVLDLSEMVNEVGVESEERRRIILVNRAIALKNLDHASEALQLLDTVEWTAMSLRFRAVVAAVRGDLAKFEDAGCRAVLAGELTKQDLLTWPAFAPARDSDEFAHVLSSATRNSVRSGLILSRKF